MFTRIRRLLLAATSLSLLGALIGCALPVARTNVSSSLVDYLYPKGELPPAYEQTVPNLPLPLNVGIAFVPSMAGRDAPSEAKKNELLAKTQLAFKDRPFIGQIVVIPEVYMRSGKGFGALDQVARLFNLDVIALVSYDQVENMNQNALSLTYWTIVGAYVVPASRHEASTFVDTAVFDVRTHKLLFRAPGISTTNGYSTALGEEARRRELMGDSFDRAMADMTVNLNKEVDTFKDRIKEDKSATVSYRPTYHGGGSLDVWTLLMLVPLLWKRRGIRSLIR